MRRPPSIAIPALLSTGLAILTMSGAQALGPSGAAMTQVNTDQSGVHDFDFFIGRWNVHHRRLKERLANSHDWVEFKGTAVAQAIMDGAGNIDDNVLEIPGGTYRAVSLRSFDPKARLWSIWWLDGRSPRGLSIRLSKEDSRAAWERSTPMTHSTGDRSVYDSSGLILQPPQRGGRRLSPPMVVRHGRRIGRWRSFAPSEHSTLARGARRRALPGTHLKSIRVAAFWQAERSPAPRLADGGGCWHF